ncbi:MAG: hypothetical protein JW712_00755 [Dehalococcoidales bacterium]|nr:hypothetical protein [Dehalococcoidales bacterium]
MIQSADMYMTGIVYSQFGSHFYRSSAEAEQSLEVMKHGNSGGRPPRNSRDTQVLLCTFAGIVIGVVVGVIIGINTMDTGGAVPGTIGGFVIGGITGSLVGDYLKKRKYRKLERLAEKLNSDDQQGPILS